MSNVECRLMLLMLILCRCVTGGPGVAAWLSATRHQGRKIRDWTPGRKIRDWTPDSMDSGGTGTIQVNYEFLSVLQARITVSSTSRS